MAYEHGGLLMSRVEHENAAEETRLLVGAAKTIASVRYCWLVTAAESGVINSRPMGGLARNLDENDWTIHFITDGRSRKAYDIRRAGKATVIFQNSDTAFVSLFGRATLREEVSDVHKHWKSAYNAYFPSEHDRANAALISVDCQCMELWIRGVTPEPFGFLPTKLERDSQRVWRTIPRSTGS